MKNRNAYVFSLVANQFYWVIGRGTCQYQRPAGKNHVVAPYQLASDDFAGDLYVRPEEIIRPASPEDVEMFKANVRERLTYDLADQIDEVTALGYMDQESQRGKHEK